MTTAGWKTAGAELELAHPAVNVEMNAPSPVGEGAFIFNGPGGRMGDHFWDRGAGTPSDTHPFRTLASGSGVDPGNPHHSQAFVGYGARMKSVALTAATPTPVRVMEP